jgi:hypothetical protein
MHLHDNPSLPVHDPGFWLRDLRLGRYTELVRHLDDDAYRAARIASLLPRRRALACVADCLDLPTDGTMAVLRGRLHGAGPAIAPYLLAADFSRRKHAEAVAEVAQAELPADLLQSCLDTRGRLHRLVAVLRLTQLAPEALVRVRGLDAWMRRRAHRRVLVTPGAASAEPLAAKLTPAWVEAAVAGVVRPRGVPPVRFEMVVPRSGGDVLLCLRRNRRRAHLWSDDGADIAHGHDAEQVLLHFTAGGRMVGLSTDASRLAERLADALATAWLGRSAHYATDLLEAHPAAVRRMVDALVGGAVPGLRLVALEVWRSPLEGQPSLTLRAHDDQPDLGPAIAHFTATTGPLVDLPERIRSAEIAFGDRKVRVVFPRHGGRPAVQFCDGRLPRRDAAAFRALVGAHFGLGAVHAGQSAG